MKNFWSNKGFGWRMARIILLLCAGLVALVMIFEKNLIYFPVKYPEGRWEAVNLAAGRGGIVPKIEDCLFETSDGITLHGWYCTPHQVTDGATAEIPARMVLLWFHGNAGNITHRYDMIRMLMRLPAQVFIVDYRGYGKSGGSPSEDGLYADARAAWDYLTTKRAVPAERIIIFGKSLGGAVAVDLASKVEPAGLIVQSSFTSVSDMAKSVLPVFPTVLLRTRMDSITKIAGIGCRKLFVHSPTDEVVPYELGHRLYEAAPAPKEFYEVRGAPHNATYIVGGDAYLDALREFIESCAPSG
ncbi:MAG: alpha/beta hydrolase [Blastocatellia bacterium]|nr:alpha/beta hydrolase [Blastocatellia bacterium]